MSTPGSPGAPLRIAVVGAGPAGFYAAAHLLALPALTVEVDMFDRLPTPYGLVRHGVAPDHQKIKAVTRGFAETAADPRFRFYGNVEFGADLTLCDLQRLYHQVLFATGAQSERRMGIPGEDLCRSYPATEFVAWYNGHPDYRDLAFDLSAETAAIVGVGNVAIDVARILCLSPQELRRTDMAPYAVEALTQSRVRDVYLLGRRGPAQAAFTNPELKEIGELAQADVVVHPAEVQLDPLSMEELARSGDRLLARKVDLLQTYAARPPAGRARRLHLRFLVSPVALLDDGRGGVGGLRLARNRLARSVAGTIVAEATGELETLMAGVVFRSVGYRGVALPGVPFDERWGVILNERGRVLDPETEKPVVGEYAAGWVKRGPSGVIGTNKPDALETVAEMAADAAAGRVLSPADPSRAALDALLAASRVRPVSYADWQHLDALEAAAGERAGSPRVKFTSREEMFRALGRQ
ncbi:MAG: FAD-dependent oxidoreductase [Dehalococcoidia bacterium]|nr:FAD-dependent oxidoreductase [Dehalococcoidia bacterium]